MWGWIWWLWTSSYTVKEPVKLVGEPYFAGQPDRVIVHPRPSGDGIWFKRGDMLTPLKVSTLRAHTEFTARFLELSEWTQNGRVWYVVEHIAAALFGALWADASAVVEVVSSDKHASWWKRAVWAVLSSSLLSWKNVQYVPVFWPGIKEPFDALYAARTPIIHTTKPSFVSDYVGLRRHTKRYIWVANAYVIECDDASVTYTEEDPQIGGKRVMKFSISDTPKITVHSSVQPKRSVITNLQPEPYSTLYAPEHLAQNPALLAARPLARLWDKITYSLFQILQPILTFQWLSEKNYVMVTPHDTTSSSVIDKMQPSFRDGQNEWFAHTVLDILAEIWPIPRAVYAQQLWLSVDVRNSNHPFRMRAIQRLFEKDYFGPRIPQSDLTV